MVIPAIQVRITRAAAFDPLGCVAATNGEIRIKIGRSERMGSKGSRRWRAGRGSRNGAIVSEIETPISTAFGALRILLQSRD